MRVKTASQLMNYVEVLQKWGKSNQKIRQFHYCLWDRELMRKQIDPTKAQYGFHTRDIATGGIAGEIRENTHQVNLSVFCETLGIQ